MDREKLTLVNLNFRVGSIHKRKRKTSPLKLQGPFSLGTKSNNIIRQQYYLLEKLEKQLKLDENTEVGITKIGNKIVIEPER